MATDIIARGMITEYKSGANINFAENEDGSVTISASGDVSSEDTVARDTINNHKLDKNNPHNVTAEQLGLGNVDNTSDISKPISKATQNALDGKSNTDHTHTKSDTRPANILYLVTIKEDYIHKLSGTTIQNGFCGYEVNQVGRNIYFEVQETNALVIIPHQWIEIMAPVKVEPKDIKESENVQK